MAFFIHPEDCKDLQAYLVFCVILRGIITACIGIRTLNRHSKIQSHHIQTDILFGMSSSGLLVYYEWQIPRDPWISEVRVLDNL